MRTMITVLAVTAWASVAPASAQVHDLREMNTDQIRALDRSRTDRVASRGSPRFAARAARNAGVLRGNSLYSDRAADTSCMVDGRPSGSLAIIRFSNSFNQSGASGQLAITEGAGRNRCANTSSRTLEVTKGGRPVTISNRMHPSA